MSKIKTISHINSNNVQKETSGELPVKQKKGRAKAAAPTSSRTSPAFEGAKFNKYGYCLKHTTVQLVKPQKGDAGRVVYQEVRPHCSACQGDKGGKATDGHRVVQGARTSEERSRARSKSRDHGGNARKASNARARSRSKARGAKPRREYDTPFDGKGRCHHHSNVQLASKKMTGGWKVLQAACPKCMDEATRDDDDRSVRSSSSRKSHQSGAGGAAPGKYDKNGCCARHPHIQVAKKKLLGGGWKVVRDCPNCGGGDVGADDYSVKSGRSASSRRSGRSGKPAAQPRGSRPGKATGSGRFGSLPFDADGYCCRHPSVQLAKKKALGGFKVLHDACPECLLDGGGDDGGRKKPVRRKSSRVVDDARSEASATSSASKKKRIRVRNLKTEDEEGNHGQYTGYVNNDHQPHGDGVMKYTDGTRYDGVWNDGSKVHGKTTKRKV